MSEALRLGVLLSGEGTGLENLLARIAAGEVPARVAVVIASQARAGGLRRAARHGVPAVAVPRRRRTAEAGGLANADLDEFNDRIHAELQKHRVEFVALLGFLSPFQPRGYLGRAINVHPALIPAFCGPGMFGKRVHDAVLARGVKLTGATVHFVDEEYDHGPIILQRAVAVNAGDNSETLAARVQAVERELVPEAIRLYAAGRLEIQGAQVRIHPG